MHTSMTTLTQIWMTSLFSNILPSDHNSDLPLSKFCRDCAYETPGGPREVQQGLGISCSNYRPLPVLWSAGHPNKLIQPPINKAFIEKYCMPRQVQGQAPQQPEEGQQQAFVDAPPPPPESTSAHLQRLERCI
ncbi:hypothetical protein HKD37_18G050707 [Glycine soja]